VARLRAAGCVFAEDEAALLEAEPVSPQEREAMIVRRVAGEPLELILGWAEFCGLRIQVAPGVFVPRQRSVLVVELVETTLRGTVAPKVLDLCCGTGALGAAIAVRRPDVRMWATDIDPAAVECARANLSSGVVISTSSIQRSTSSTTGGRVLLGDLYDPLPDDLELDVIVANAPYVPSDQIRKMPPEARDHEHRVALDGGADGLDVQRRVIEQAPKHLVPGGVLVIESGQEQAPVTASLMREQGLVAEVHHDEELYATAVTGTV
jgi:release factor glutamine methyltransferase